MTYEVVLTKDADLTLDEILSYLDVDNKFVWRRKGKTVVIADR